MTAVPAAEQQQQQQQHHHHHQPARGVTEDDISSSAELERASATAVHVQQAPSDEKDKIARILSACRDRDLEALCELACSEKGLVDDEVRRTACKFLDSLGHRRCCSYAINAHTCARANSTGRPQRQQASRCESELARLVPS